MEALIKVRAAGCRLWVEDGRLEVVAPAALDANQVAFLRQHKQELVEALTTPHGNSYLWRRIDPANVAGWRVHYSRDSLDEVQAMFGDRVEVRALTEPLSAAEGYRCLEVSK